MLIVKIVLASVWAVCAAFALPRLWQSYRRGERSKSYYAQQAWLWSFFLVLVVGGFVPSGHWAKSALLGLELVCLIALIWKMWRMWPDIADTGAYKTSSPRTRGKGDTQR